MSGARVLALVGDGWAGCGGIAQYNRDVLSALSAIGVEQVVTLPRRSAGASVDLPPRVREEPARGSRAAWVAQALGVACRLRPDLILCTHVHFLPVAVVLARVCRARLVLHAYGIEVWSPPGRHAARLVRHVDRVLAISRFTRERLLAWADVPPHSVRVLPNAIDLARYAPGSAPESLRRRYGLVGRRVLLTLSRLDPTERYKGHDRILDLLPRLAARVPDLTWVIAGDGADRGRLQAAAQRMGLADRVLFIGSVAEAEKADHYRLADAFAMPSTGEGFGFTFLEAAACGVPVLGGDRDGSRDALRDGALGLLVDPHDPEVLLAGLVEVLHRPRGVPMGLQVFSFTRFREQLKRLLQPLLPAAEPRAPLACVARTPP